MMIGRMTSLPLPVELPSAEGTGVAGTEAIALGGTETEAVGDGGRRGGHRRGGGGCRAQPP